MGIFFLTVDFHFGKIYIAVRGKSIKKIICPEIEIVLDRCF